MEQTTQNVITNVALFSFLAILGGLVIFACIYSAVLDKRYRKQNYYDKTHYVEFWYCYSIYEKTRKFISKIVSNQEQVSKDILYLQAKQNCVPIEQYLYDDYGKQIEEYRQMYFEYEEQIIEQKKSYKEQEDYMRTIPRPKGYFSDKD